MAGWLYFSEDGARDERGMTRLVPRDALDDVTTRSRRGRCDHARRVRPDRAPARPASRVSRRHLTRRSAKSMGWNPKNPMVRGCVGGHGRSTAAVLTDFLSALSHPVESNAKGNARRPLATPSVPVEEGYGARRTRNIEKLGSRLGQKLHPTSYYGRTKIAEKYDNRSVLYIYHLASRRRTFLGGAHFLARRRRERQRG